MKDPIDFYTFDLFPLPFRNDEPDTMACPVCQTLLVIPRTGRPPVYCSNACKMVAYRRRASLRNSPLTIEPLRNYGYSISRG